MNILDSIILFGAVQGIITTFIIRFSRTGSSKPAQLLSGLIFLLALAELNIYLMDTGVQYKFPALRVAAFFVPLLVVMPIGPLLYFYIKSVSTGLTKVSKLHFLSTILDFIPYVMGLIYVLSYSRQSIITGQANTFTEAIDLVNTYIDIPRWLSLTVYLIMSFGVMFKSRSDKRYDRKRLVLLYVFAAFQAIWLMHLIPYILPATRPLLVESVGWYPLYLPLSVLVYAMGFYGIIVHNRTPSQSNVSPLPAEVVAQTVNRLTEAMEKDSLYLNASLTLESVVKHVGISQKTISAVLNGHLQKSFNEFVNEYRVNEFKKRLSDPSKEHLTMTGIALECGFNSNATFQRAFKQVMLMTPSAYRAACGRKIIQKDAQI